MTKLQNYIKQDLRESIGDQNYLYLLELDDDGVVEKQIALDKDNKVIHKITSKWPDGDFRWEFSKFTKEEIKENKISKEEFDKYWTSI